MDRRDEFHVLTELDPEAFLAASERIYKRQVREALLVISLQRAFRLRRLAIGVAGVLIAISEIFASVSPSRASHFILLLIPKRSREHLIGDLEEEYRTKVLPEYGRFWARLWYWEQTILAIGFYMWPMIKRVLGLAAIWKVIGR